MRDREIPLQAKLLNVSPSHHSFYNNHIRHQLSGMAAFWEPGAPRRCTTHSCSGTVEACQPFSKPNTLFNWFIYLFTTFRIWIRGNTSWASDEGIQMGFTPVWCNYAGRSPPQPSVPTLFSYDRPLPKVRSTGLWAQKAAAVTAGLLLMPPLTSWSDWRTPGHAKALPKEGGGGWGTKSYKPATLT